jgi:hypothetical protein
MDLLINIGYSCSAHVSGLQLYAPSIYDALFNQVERTVNMYNCKKRNFPNKVMAERTKKHVLSPAFRSF